MLLSAQNIMRGWTVPVTDNETDPSQKLTAGCKTLRWNLISASELKGEYQQTKTLICVSTEIAEVAVDVAVEVKKIEAKVQKESKRASNGGSKV